jgi:hypothetical protein
MKSFLRRVGRAVLDGTLLGIQIVGAMAIVTLALMAFVAMAGPAAPVVAVGI